MENNFGSEHKILRFVIFLVAITIVGAFFLPWVSTGFNTVTGIHIPRFNESLTKIANVKYIFTPSHKESTKIAYAIYTIPTLSILAMIFALLAHVQFSKHTLLIASVFGICLSIYFYFRVSNVLSISNVGMGVHLLLGISFLYLSLFFIFGFRKKQSKPELVQPEGEEEGDRDNTLFDKI